MQGLQLTAVYQQGGPKSPWDLLNDTGKFKHSDGAGSLKQLMEDNGGGTLRLDEHVALTPMEWRKPGYVRAGREGYRGPYTDEPAPQQERWWGDTDRSTPQQDRARRQGE